MECGSLHMEVLKGESVRTYNHYMHNDLYCDKCFLSNETLQERITDSKAYRPCISGISEIAF